jgi:hypothetical protein
VSKQDDARKAENAKTLRYIKAERIKAEKASRRAVKAGSKVGNKKMTRQGGMTKKGKDDGGMQDGLNTL